MYKCPVLSKDGCTKVMVTAVFLTVIAISGSTCFCSMTTMYSLTIFFMGRVGGRFMGVQNVPFYQRMDVQR